MIGFLHQPLQKIVYNINFLFQTEVAMWKVFDISSNLIGHFNGHTIFDCAGDVMYRVLENEIFSPLKHAPSDFQVPYKGLLGLIGRIEGGAGLSADNETLFTLNKNTSNYTAYIK